MASRSPAWLAVLVLVALPLCVAACGDGAPAAPSPTPTPSPTIGGPGDPVPPDLPEDADFVTGDVVRFDLAPGSVRTFDPVEAALAIGEPVVCPAVVASWAWDAPGDSDPGMLTVVGERNNILHELGRGPSGTASTGCVLVIFENSGTEPLSVTVAFRVGTVYPIEEESPAATR